MEKFVVNGGKPLCGEVTIGGAKNAAVAIIPAAILSDGVCRIENLPQISDVSVITEIMSFLGAEIRVINKTTIEIDPRRISNPVAEYEIVRKMRASYYLLGALLGRFSSARVAMPGGCDFGVRPIDQHLKGFERLGAKVSTENGMIDLTAEDGLKGDHIYLDKVTVGATINIMLAAVKAEGLTVIENAAREPHVVDVANFLNSMGGDVRGAGTDTIKIRGVKSLRGSNYSIIPDQIEAGTYMAAAVATGGDVVIKNVIPKHLDSITAKLIEMGACIEEDDDSIHIFRSGKIRKCNVKTLPHPGFPTDMQPQITAILSIAEGTSIVTEDVWDNRFRYVEELSRFGAQISVESGRIAIVEGVKNLTGAPVKATDLRAGAAMIIAALVADGRSEISEIAHIERGYENIVEKISSLGGDIRRVSVPDNKVRLAL